METEAISEKRIQTWLFNPFYYIAGGKALTIGVALILITGLIGALSNSHFDGVLDFHTGLSAPLWMFIFEGLLDWIVMGVLLFLGGKAISKSHARLLDVFGTQALARFPTLVTVIFALLAGYRRFTEQVIAQPFDISSLIQRNTGDFILFTFVVIVAILMLVWMVALMYRAFTVSCNVRGCKAIGIFIAALILGEVISKIALIAMANAILLGR